MLNLNTFRERLDKIFAENKDKRSAHQKAQTVLKDMGANDEVLFAILLKSMQEKGFFEKTRINPVLGMTVFDSLNYTLIAHLWLPRPDGSLELSHQSIHHHGKLLLSSVAAYGPGYESILFSNQHETDPNTLETKLKIHKIYRNHKGSIDFCDSFAPHIVFYPEKISVTYALWSNEKNEAKSKIKNIAFIKKNKKLIKDLLNTFGLSKAAGLNVVENFDFHVKEGKIFVMKERVRYPEGTNKNFLQALFYSLQEINFPYLKEIKKKSMPISIQTSVNSYIEQIEKGQKIENVFEATHLSIPKVTLPKKEVLACFPEYTP